MLPQESFVVTREKPIKFGQVVFVQRDRPVLFVKLESKYGATVELSAHLVELVIGCPREFGKVVCAIEMVAEHTDTPFGFR